MDKTTILDVARGIFARSGYDGLRMRTLAAQLKMPLSLLYHYFPSKDELLKQLFEQTNKSLGVARAALPEQATAAAMLRQRIAFQFDHAEEIVTVLKYYLHFRLTFSKRGGGYLPEKSTLHIDEVLEFGIKTGEFTIDDLPATSHVITHAINGYLLEYYPADVTVVEQKRLVQEIADFMLRALH